MPKKPKLTIPAILTGILIAIGVVAVGTLAFLIPVLIIDWR